MMLMDPLYLMLALPGLLFGIVASLLVKSTFSKYAKVGARSGLTGAEAARQMLAAQGVHNVDLHETHGFMTDHYDPRNHSLNLSSEVFHGQSLSSIGVACHEAGHALQQAQGYALMGLRTTLLPATIVGQNIAPILLMIGLGTGLLGLAKLGVLLFGIAVLFSIITLPIEWDASARAKRYIASAGVVTASEYPFAAKVLNAAFLTYVAGAITAVLQLLYFLLRTGLLGGRRND
jgi:Zn-dependent membrane protease YugP